MRLTLAICTWNRAALLDRTLAEMHRLRIPRGVQWELVVVNNNCTDGTDRVIARHAAALPIRRIVEPRQGKSYALNRTLDEATGDWIVFTDDDVLVDPGLLEAYAGAIADSGEDVAFLGGMIEPWFPQPPDPVLARAIPTVASGFCGVDERDPGIRADRSIRAVQDKVPYGANCAVARHRLGGVRYDEQMGPTGRARITGEEVLFFRSLLARGLTGRWVVAARLRHYVPPSRLTMTYLRRHLFDLGRTGILLNGIPPGRMLLGVPGWIWRDVLGYGTRGVLAAVLRNRYGYLHSTAGFYLRLGMLHQCLRAPLAARAGAADPTDLPIG
jgi:glucosyl-dolichyl phosphate glucuronosyltransferase